MKVQHPISLFVEGDAFIAMIGIHGSSSSRVLRHEIAPPDQVVRRRGEGKDPVDESAAAMAELAEQADRFHPAEGLLDQFPLPLAHGVAGVTQGTAVEGTAAAPFDGGRDMRRDVHPAHRGDPVARVVQFVGADGDAPRGQGQLAEHDDRGVTFGRPGRRRDGGVDDQTVPILREQMAEIGSLASRPTAFL